MVDQYHTQTGRLLALPRPRSFTYESVPGNRKGLQSPPSHPLLAVTATDRRQIHLAGIHSVRSNTCCGIHDQDHVRVAHTLCIGHPRRLLGA